MALAAFLFLPVEVEGKILFDVAAILLMILVVAHDNLALACDPSVAVVLVVVLVVALWVVALLVVALWVVALWVDLGHPLGAHVELAGKEIIDGAVGISLDRELALVVAVGLDLRDKKQENVLVGVENAALEEAFDCSVPPLSLRFQLAPGVECFPTEVLRFLFSDLPFHAGFAETVFQEGLFQDPRLQDQTSENSLAVDNLEGTAFDLLPHVQTDICRHIHISLPFSSADIRLSCMEEGWMSDHLDKTHLADPYFLHVVVCAEEKKFQTFPVFSPLESILECLVREAF